MVGGVIVVAGEALVDLVAMDSAGQRYDAHPGGGPFNTAVALGRLGVPVAFLGWLSEDGFGRLLDERLAAAGVDRGLTRTVGASTPLAVVAPAAHGGENEYRFYLDGTAVVSNCDDAGTDLTGAAALHVGTLALALEASGSVLEALVAREGHQLLVALDPNVRPALGLSDAYRGRIERLAAMADVVKLSEADAAWLAPDQELDALARRWQEAGSGLVVATLGRGGAVTWVGGRRFVVPAVAMNVVDTVGAGDAFGAGLLAWLHDHDGLTKTGVRALDGDAVTAAVAFAHRVAGLTCARAGADPPWRHELDAAPT
jgi:fructokinase